MKTAITVSVYVAFLFSAPAWSSEVGFYSGNKFAASAIHGYVSLVCPGGATAEFSCRDKVLEPNSFDYFIGPAGMAADSVSLSSLRSDRSRREMAAGYDAAAGRSSASFNLWISGLFERPLLLSGENSVRYTLSSRGKQMAEGTFIVKVSQGEPRECPAVRYESTDPQDCQSPYTVCQRYFEQFENCR